MLVIVKWWDIAYSGVRDEWRLVNIVALSLRRRREDGKVRCDRRVRRM